MLFRIYPDDDEEEEEVEEDVDVDVNLPVLKNGCLLMVREDFDDFLESKFVAMNSSRV